MEASNSAIYSVLSVKPFSGYYTSCPVCKSKVKEDISFGQEVETKSYWCLKCSHSISNVTYTYCLALSITDGKTCTNTISFGNSLNTLLGATAAELHQFLMEHVAMSNTDNLSSNSTNNFASKIHEVLEEVFVGRHFKFIFKTLANPKTSGHNGSELSCSVVVSNIKPLLSHTPSINIIVLLRQKLAHGMLKNVENFDQENSYSTQTTPVYNDLLSNTLYCDNSYTEQSLVQLDFSISTPSNLIPCASDTEDIMVNDDVITTSFEKDQCLDDVSFIPSTQFWCDFFQPDSPISPSHGSLDNRQDQDQKEQDIVTMATHKDGMSHDLGYNEESIDPEIEICLAIELEKDWIASQKSVSSSAVVTGSQVWPGLSIGQVLNSTTSITYTSSCTPLNCNTIDSGCGTSCSVDPSISPDLFAATPQSHSFLSSSTAISHSFSGPDIFKSSVHSRDKRTVDEAAIVQITCGQRYLSTTSHRNSFNKAFEPCDKSRFKWTSSTPVFPRQQVTKRKLKLLKQTIKPQQYDESCSVTCQTSLSSFSQVNTPPSCRNSCSKTGFSIYNTIQTPQLSQGQNDFLTMESPDLI